MSYLSDWADTERRANPDRFDAEMDRLRWRHFMATLKLCTSEVSADCADAADRLEAIFA